MKKIVLTGGGTLGHVTPHLALIPRLQAAGYEIHYIGTENGMEAPKMRAVPGSPIMRSRAVSFAGTTPGRTSPTPSASSPVLSSPPG